MRKLPPAETVNSRKQINHFAHLSCGHAYLTSDFEQPFLERWHINAILSIRIFAVLGRASSSMQCCAVSWRGLCWPTIILHMMMIHIKAMQNIVLPLVCSSLREWLIGRVFSLRKCSIRREAKCRKSIGKIFQSRRAIARAVTNHGCLFVWRSRYWNSPKLIRKSKAAKGYRRRAYYFLCRSRTVVCTTAMIHPRTAYKQSAKSKWNTLWMYRNQWNWMRSQTTYHCHENDGHGRCVKCNGITAIFHTIRPNARRPTRRQPNHFLRVFCSDQSKVKTQLSKWVICGTILNTIDDSNLNATKPNIRWHIIVIKYLFPSIRHCVVS